VLDEHRDLLRAAFARHDGYEVDTQGDSFFAAFGSATSDSDQPTGRRRPRGFSSDGNSQETCPLTRAADLDARIAENRV
jgi:class 3 adenylate cyclase